MDLCPKCKKEGCYPDGDNWVCPWCSHEWNPAAEATAETEAAPEAASSEVRDANGNLLVDGDSVVVMKNLPIKGAGGPIRSGTKVRNIRISHAVEGHNIFARIDGVGQVYLKSEFVKKA
jgi:protein PhnA